MESSLSKHPFRVRQQRLNQDSRYRVFPAWGLVRIPDQLTLEEASTLPCAGLSKCVTGLTGRRNRRADHVQKAAYNALYGAPSQSLRPGQWVLTLGKFDRRIGVQGLKRVLCRYRRCFDLCDAVCAHWWRKRDHHVELRRQVSSTDNAEQLTRSYPDTQASEGERNRGTARFSPAPHQLLQDARLGPGSAQDRPAWRSLHHRGGWEQHPAQVLQVHCESQTPSALTADPDSAFDALEALGGIVVAAGNVGGAGSDQFPDANGLVTFTNSSHRGLMIGSRAQFVEMLAHIEATDLSAFRSPMPSFHGSG